MWALLPPCVVVIALALFSEFATPAPEKELTISISRGAQRGGSSVRRRFIRADLNRSDGRAQTCKWEMRLLDFLLDTTICEA
jgi:hypothetical protein